MIKQIFLFEKFGGRDSSLLFILHQLCLFFLKKMGGVVYQNVAPYKS